MITNTIRYRPTRISGPTKADVQSKIFHNFNCSWGSTSTKDTKVSGYFTGFGHEIRNVVLVNYIKTRAKARVFSKTIQGLKGPTRVRQQIRPPHWDAFVYVIPMNVIKNANQKTRNFEVSFK